MLAEEGNLISADASLIRATSNGDAEAVNTLLAGGADVNQRGRGGQTALMVAAIFSHVEIARLLLAAGADVRLKDNLGLTARAWAQRRGSAEVGDLIFNDLPAEEVLSEKEEANVVRPKVEADSGRLAAEGKTSLQQLALRMTKRRPRTMAAPQRGEEENVGTSLSEPGAERIPQAPSQLGVDATSSTKGAIREVEEASHASEREPKTLPEPDTLRFMKFHKQIMAAQQRRQAEQERHDEERDHGNTEWVRRNTEDAGRSFSELKADRPPQADNQAGLVDANWSPTGTHAEVEQTHQPSPIETNTDPPKTNTEPLQHVTGMSEQGAVATWSSTEVIPSSEQEPPSLTDAALLSEQGAVATWSSTDTPPFSEQEALATSPSADATLLSEQKAVATRSSTDLAILSEWDALSTSSAIDPTLFSEWEDIDTPSSRVNTLLPAPEVLATPSSTDAPLLSEQGAVATWSSTDTPPLSEPEALPTPSSSDPTSLSEQGAVTTWSSTDTPLLSELEATSSTESTSRPTASQLARIAATRDHLRIQEDSRQRPEVEVSPESEGTTPAERELDHDQNDTLQRSALPIRPTTLEPKTLESSKTAPVKRCPQCNATYGNPLLMYCAYDATKLVTADNSSFSYTAENDRSRQTLWALVAIIAVLGASLGYLLNNYRSRDRASNAPVADVSTAPVPVRVEQPETAREGLPIVGGALSGMELDVPQPEYPAQARTEGGSGTVTVRVQVNQRGRVIRVRSSGGDSQLRAAAVEAAQKATFSPEKLAAQGRTVSGTITYNFAAQTESATATGSPAPAQTNSPSESESSAATGSSAGNEGEDYPVVGGLLVGAENNLPQADYPETARSRGIDGTVTVTVRVNRAGKVISWRTSKADSLLRAAALKAAKKATFSPEMLPGTGDVVGTITYNFKG